jgi:hypothetical protein
VGENLTGVEHVYFGDEQARFLRLSSRHLITFSPPGSGSVAVTVVTSAGSSIPTDRATFTYLTTPIISSLSPATGSVGTRVSIFGDNFALIQEVQFGDQRADFQLVSSIEIVAFAPPGRGTVTVSVVAEGGASTPSTSTQFTYVPERPHRSSPLLSATAGKSL